MKYIEKCRAASSRSYYKEVANNERNIKMNLEEVKKDLKQILSEKRYTHSVGTMNMARELAHIYGEDEEKAAFTGLIHDIAKEMSRDEIEQYVKAHNIEVDDIEKQNLGLLHAKIGASIAKERYNASEKVQNAIKYHTTGNVKMDTFAKIIYVADKVEENRTYEGVEELRKLAKQDLDKTILILIDFVIEKSNRLGRIMHPDTVELREKLINGTK